MRKEDLKFGMVVKTKSGLYLMVTQYGDNEKVLVNNGSSAPLNSYNDDLENKIDRFDIVEVYGLAESRWETMNIGSRYRKLLWKRPEKTLLSDFKEKYPNAPLDEEDGTPTIICPHHLGYERKKCVDFDRDCNKCWSRPLE